ncbi:MAG TPA: hypothetical protein VKY82_06600 [Flavobacterium sp.]|nr:hypothetical protein [Flavobacterium sp.]
MKKRSSKAVQLLLITSVLASCSKPAPKTENEVKQQVFMRADSTAQYTNVTQQYDQQRSHSGGMGSALLWYMAFRHLGGGMGYASSGLKPQSVVGTNTAKANAYNKTATRGGFGSTAKKSNVSASS